MNPLVTTRLEALKEGTLEFESLAKVIDAIEQHFPKYRTWCIRNRRLWEDEKITTEQVLSDIHQSMARDPDLEEVILDILED